MMTIAGIGFTYPWLLAGLLLLPLLWLLLRAIPPAPLRRAFPAVTLLLGLKDDESVSDRTPWWLLLLRMLAVAAAIVGLAGPVLNPTQTDNRSDRPLLLLLDGSWAGATQWSETLETAETILEDAARKGRSVAIQQVTRPQEIQFRAARAWQGELAGLQPTPWQATPDMVQDAIGFVAQVERDFDTLWFSDTLDYDNRDALLETLASRGELTVHQNAEPRLALLPAEFQDGAILLKALRSMASAEQELTLQAHGRDPGGTERVLATVSGRFDPEETMTELKLSLPAELRARVSRFTIAGQNSAGSVALTDDTLSRREIALIAGRENREGLELLSSLHYLRQALAPTTELLEGSVGDLLPANPDVVVLADIAQLSSTETDAILDWVDAGGLLLRFAGPRLAASDISRQEEDPLMPVRLRSGGRSVGGAMSWGAPKTLAPFQEGSPFFGLNVPDDVSVRSQVVAQPDPTLSDRVIASLGDGTPLVTRKTVGSGQVVLFHVTANAEWSNLPLSGLFVEMLERLAISTSDRMTQPEELQGTTWKPATVLNGFGTPSPAGTLHGVSGESLISDALGPNLRPGLYQNEQRRLARNVVMPGAELTPIVWPASVTVVGGLQNTERPLGGPLLALCLLLLVADIFASLALTGRLGVARLSTPAFALLLMFGSGDVQAQTTEAELSAASELVLAYVLTGDPSVDDISRAGLQGLSDTLFFRTSVEPAAPMGVDLERDDIALFPFLYWPISTAQPQPSGQAYAKLNTYLRSGGMILFDTRDANIAGYGAASPTGRKLQQLARPLDIPPLEPVPQDHVLTRAFYLLQDFPGRHHGGALWVEAAPPDAELAEGMPFRNLNDGVTPVVIGGNDWAAAWATGPDGRALVPVGRGFAGERQRELAYRFGVNLIMHVLTGNYKSDQVHVPALLDRLGQ